MSGAPSSTPPDRPLADAAFLRAPSAQRVMRALCATEKGLDPGRARFVGGCVRNALLGVEVDDIDIATPLTPAEVARAAAAAGLGVHETGREHGTLTLTADKKPFEVTTLRRDVTTDGRHAQVAFTDDWALDAQRRDFTMNALYADLDGAVYDPNGQGRADLAARHVRFIGDAQARLAEDQLRSLRFFRFTAYYGGDRWDEAGLAACRAAREGLLILSAERVWKELRKLLAAPDPRGAIAQMKAAGIAAVLAPEWTEFSRFEALISQDVDYFYPADALLRVAALLGGNGAAERFARRLKLARAETARLTDAVSDEPGPESYLSARDLRRWLYRIGRQAALDRLRLAWAARPSPGLIVQWRTLIAMAESWAAPKFPLTGADFLAAGLPAGPLIGRAQAALEAWWIDVDFPDDRLALQERLKAVAQGLVN